MRRLWLLLLLFTPQPTLGDGKAFLAGADRSAWTPLAEREQVALIAHRDGVQTLLLAIRVDLAAGARAVWIVPVPGALKDVRIGVEEQFPQLRGYQPRQRLRHEIRSAPILLIPFTLGVPCGSLSVLRGVERGVSVDEGGLHVESLQADSAAALRTYLSDKGADVAETELACFTHYFGEAWTLIVGWIADPDEFQDTFGEMVHDAERRRGAQTATAPASRPVNSPSRRAQSRTVMSALTTRWPCLRVEFPCERPFFPLRPTADYGAAIVPLRLFALGFWQVETDAALAAQIKVEHFAMSARESRFRGSSLDWYAVMAAEEGYSLIRAHVTADQYRDDLRLTPTNPGALWQLARRLDRISLLLLIMVHVLLSYICGGVAGWLLWRRWHGPALLGLLNVLTIHLIWIGARMNTGVCPVGRAPAGNGPAPWKDLLSFLAIFLVLYVVALIVVGALAGAV